MVSREDRIVSGYSQLCCLDVFFCLFLHDVCVLIGLNITLYESLSKCENIIMNAVCFFFFSFFFADFCWTALMAKHVADSLCQQLPPFQRHPLISLQSACRLTAWHQFNVCCLRWQLSNGLKWVPQALGFTFMILHEKEITGERMKCNSLWFRWPFRGPNATLTAAGNGFDNPVTEAIKQSASYTSIHDAITAINADPWPCAHIRSIMQLSTHT